MHVLNYFYFHEIPISNSKKYKIWFLPTLNLFK